MHAHKAHYLRLAYDSDPANVMHLMEKIWNLQRPRLVITIHGGMTNFKFYYTIFSFVKFFILKGGR